MPWHWTEPGSRGRCNAGFPTELEAKKNAVFTACNGKQVVTNPETLAQLWASLEGAGWSTGFYST